MIKHSSKLEKINASAYNYTNSVKPIMDQICAPLYRFGIPKFAYGKILPSGRYLYLSSEVGTVREYFASIQQMDPIFYEQMLKSGGTTQQIFLPSNKELLSARKTNPILELLFNCNFWNILNIFKIDKFSTIHAYGFAMGKEFQHATSFFLANIGLINRFIEYFDEMVKITKIADTSDSTKLAHFNQSFDFHQLSEERMLDAKIQRFLQEITFDKKMITASSGEMVKLTKREIDCMNYLVMGYGAKGVASILGITPRCVESYLQNIKNKTGHYTRQSLITAFIDSFKPFNF